MRGELQAHPPLQSLIAYFRHGDGIRSRSVGEVVLSGNLDIPQLPARLLADWTRDAALDLEPGDVLPLSLARARARWPGYRRCVQAVSDWMCSLGLQEAFVASEVALMACSGARYHHDGARYGSAAFCNLFLSESRELDLHFAATGHRLPLGRGSAVIFDTGQPHAVIARGNTGFEVDDFPAGHDRSSVFLTWELPIEHPDLARALGITLDIDPSTAVLLDEAQVRVDGAHASVCPDSGRWRGSRSPPIN